MTTLLSKLVGTSFYRHATEISKMVRINHVPEKPPLPLLLVREPENPHDKNAIAVYIKLGHVERDKAAILADVFDQPENTRICVYAKADIDASGQINVATEIPEA